MFSPDTRILSVPTIFKGRRRLYEGGTRGFLGDAAPNLIRDAAMDTDTNGDGVVDGWDSEGSGTFSLDTSTSPNSQKITVAPGDGDTIVRHSILRVFPGDEITVSVDLKFESTAGSPGGAALAINWLTASNGIAGQFATQWTNTSFQRRSVTKVAPANTAFVLIDFYFNAETVADDAGSAWFRNARLLRGSSDPATYANPHVSGASQTGFFLATAGWPASTTVLRRGDAFLCGGSGASRAAADPFSRILVCASEIVSDANGAATITLATELDIAPPDGAALRFNPPR